MSMLAFLSIAFLVYGSMHLYALGKVWQAFPHSTALGVVLLLGGLVMTFSPLILWHVSRQGWHSAASVASWVTYTWMGFLFLFCCIALLFDLGHVLASVIGLKWFAQETTAFITVALLSLAMLGYGFVEAGNIRVEEVIITTHKLPAAVDHVTIAQISDLHLGAMLGNGFLEKVIAQLREIQPDIVVATGDIVDGQGDSLNALAQRFRSFTPPKGAYAVIGNHESYVGLDDSIGFLRNAGFTVLRGSSAAAGNIIIAGVDDPSTGPSGQAAGLEMGKALAGIRKDNFVVLLKHQPVVDESIPFDLQLSGHIHGGQIFPFGLFTRLSYGVHTGLTQLGGGRILYVNRGAGTWGPPIRIFAAPEITLIKIVGTGK